MNSKDLKGIAVVGIADGARPGTVDRAYVDPATKRVVGFGFGTGGGLLRPESSGLVDAHEVRSLGPDALTLESRSAARGEETGAAGGDLIELDDLTKRKVVTEGGTSVGQVASIEFDGRTFRLTEIEASPGFFESNRRVPVDQVISVGDDDEIVADAVCAPDAGVAGTSARAEGRFVVGDVRPTG